MVYRELPAEKDTICVASLQKGPNKLRFLLILIEQVMTNLLKK